MFCILLSPVFLAAEVSFYGNLIVWKALSARTALCRLTLLHPICYTFVVRLITQLLWNLHWTTGEISGEEIFTSTLQYHYDGVLIIERKLIHIRLYTNKINYIIFTLWLAYKLWICWCVNNINVRINVYRYLIFLHFKWNLSVCIRLLWIRKKINIR